MPSPSQPRPSNDPIRLVNPRFVGRDDARPPFVLTAVTATRDPQRLPAGLSSTSRPWCSTTRAPIRCASPPRTGVYHEDTRKLEVSGGVRLAGARGAFDTAQSLFDTKTGELVGSGPIQGLGSLGEIQAKSYGVYDKGARMVFNGGVHTRLQPK